MRAFLENNRMFFTTHSFTHEDLQRNGAKRAIQRFEQCIAFLSNHMQPAFEAMKVDAFYDQSVKNSATELVQLAVADALEYISKNEKISNDTRDFITDKLKSVKLWVMFSEEIRDTKKINSVYNELDFDGSEPLIALSINIRRHNVKITMNPDALYIIVREDSPFYLLDANILSEYLYQL